MSRVVSESSLETITHQINTVKQLESHLANLDKTVKEHEALIAEISPNINMFSGIDITAIETKIKELDNQYKAYSSGIKTTLKSDKDVLTTKLMDQINSYLYQFDTRKTAATNTFTKLITERYNVVSQIKTPPIQQLDDEFTSVMNIVNSRKNLIVNSIANISDLDDRDLAHLENKLQSIDRYLAIKQEKIDKLTPLSAGNLSTTDITSIKEFIQDVNNVISRQNDLFNSAFGKK